MMTTAGITTDSTVTSLFTMIASPPLAQTHDVPNDQPKAQPWEQPSGQPIDQLTIQFFGTVQLHLNDRDLTTTVGAKALALLAYLAVAAPQPVARTQLAGLLWSDKTEDAARYRLRHLLWELRRLLGKTHLHADDEYCRLSGEGLWIDVIALQAGITRLRIDQPQATVVDPERLRQVVDLYQGDFCGRLKVREAPLFEEWALVAQERFQLRYQQLLDCLAQAQRAAGDEDGTIQTLLRLIEADPLREQSYRALMSAYARQGDRAAALRIYAQCKVRLANELGVPPDEETETLRQQLIAQTPESKHPGFARALHLFQAGRIDDALAACAAAEGDILDPNTGQALALLRAEIALIRGDVDTARQLIQIVRQTLQPGGTVGQ